jgi:hypothetical protein
LFPNQLRVQDTQRTVGAERPTDPLAQSVLGALAYADLFDYPLSSEEIRRYQIATSYSGDEIALCLATSPHLQNAVSSRDGLYCLRGREATFEIRRERSEASRRVWRRAAFYARWLARMPFVRMVAITGALAVDNVASRPDIDLLVVTSEGRVWISRRLIIALVRFARLFGDDLCPNYIISETNLNLEQQDLFTAHELSQMVPLYGKKVYMQLLAHNRWALDYLPSAFTPLRERVPTLRRGLLRRAAERVLSAHLLDSWEQWELGRLQRKVRPLVGDAAEVICSPQQCKGHTGLHRQWVTTRYNQRLSELGL